MQGPFDPDRDSREGGTREGGSPDELRHSREGELPASPDNDDLAAAHQAWADGHWSDARLRAQKALATAAAHHDQRREASASLLLARALALESQFDWSRRFAQAALQLSRESGDEAGALEALLAVSRVESALGHDEEALRAAAEAVSGSRHLPLLHAAALDAVGVASLWAGDHGTARGALDAACEIARKQAGTRDASFQPLVDAAFAEALRGVDQRLQGRPVDASELESLLARARQLKAIGATAGLVQSVPRAALLLLLAFAEFQGAHLAGDAAGDDGHYLACLACASRLPAGSWMQSLAWWARLERAMVGRNPEEVLESAQALSHVSAMAAHEPMKRLAERVCAHAHEWLRDAPSFSATWF